MPKYENDNHYHFHFTYYITLEMKVNTFALFFTLFSQLRMIIKLKKEW